MLSIPRFTNSLLDVLDDDFWVFPLDYVVPQQGQLTTNKGLAGGRLAVPHIKDNKYQVSLDLRHFDPSEVSVKVDQNSLQIQGKREKKSEDGTHYEYREYQQQFTLPDAVQAEQLKCQLSPKGLLTIEAPVTPAIDEAAKHKNIPIEFVKK